MGESTKFEELKWIEEKPIPLDSQGRSLFRSKEQKKAPYLKRLLDQVVTPIFLAATVGCLCLGLGNLITGNSKNQQMFMRGRILFQAGALVTMMGGLAYVKQVSLKEQKEEEEAERRLLADR